MRLLYHIFRVFIRQSGQRRPGGRGIVGRCHDRHGVSGGRGVGIAVPEDKPPL